LAQERVIRLATARGEADEAVWRVCALEGVQMATRQARDTVEENFLSMVAKVTVAERQRVAAEEYCKHLVHELTLLSLRVSKLCMTITGTLPQPPLPEGMCFAIAQHIELAMLLFVLWMAVSLAAQSMLRCLLIEGS
jgi:hypothetical protein